jgi:hypothetical protein
MGLVAARVGHLAGREAAKLAACALGPFRGGWWLRDLGAARPNCALCPTTWGCRPVQVTCEAAADDARCQIRSTSRRAARSPPRLPTGAQHSTRRYAGTPAVAWRCHGACRRWQSAHLDHRRRERHHGGGDPGILCGLDRGRAAAIASTITPGIKSACGLPISVTVLPHRPGHAHRQDFHCWREPARRCLRTINGGKTARRGPRSASPASNASWPRGPTCSLR